MLEARMVKDRMEAGCDEVGRGCLAGPVVAAAVILPEGYRHPNLKDSKVLSEKQRLEMKALIEANAIAWSVSFVPPVIIDRINILRASFLGMERAIKRLKTVPEHLLIDGNRFYTTLTIPYTCLIKGDSKNASIAAASILAKTYRDDYMKRVNKDHPDYGWETNMGYPTFQHRNALKSLGPTPLHRKSFRLIPEQLELDFIHQQS